MSGGITNEVQEFKNNEIIIDNKIFALHFFKPEKIKNIEPVFIIPPHAGRHGCIAQKMINKCCAEGRQVYAFELKSATKDTCRTDISDLVYFLDRCVERIINRHHFFKVGLIGLCQGAWLGAIYTSKYPNKISFYCNFAGPINTQTGQDNIIEEYCKTASINQHKAIVEACGGIQPGIFQWMSFAMVNPKFVFIDRWLDFIKISVNDIFKSEKSESMQKWINNNSWYDTPNDLAGVWFLECLENHFIENRLYNADWKIGNEFVYLSSIKCPVYLYAGEDDEITHPKQVFDMESVVGSKDVHKTLFPNAGHTRVFVGKDELEHFANQVLR